MKEPSKDILENCYWVCSHCGPKYGRRLPIRHVPKYIAGYCDICETHKQVTEFSNYGYQKK